MKCEVQVTISSSSCQEDQCEELNTWVGSHIQHQERNNYLLILTTTTPRTPLSLIDTRITAVQTQPPKISHPQPLTMIFQAHPVPQKAYAQN